MAIALWILRHGKALVPTGTCYGRLDVAADDAHTRAAAAAFVSAWRLEHATPPDILWCSPMRRTRQMVSALQEEGLTASLQEKPELAEMDFGTWEGQSWETIGKDALSHWTDDFWHHRTGQGESVSALLSRVDQALTETWTMAQTIGQAGREPVNVLWVTHAGVVRAVDALLHLRDRFPLQARDWPSRAPGPGEWVVFKLDERMR
jgi:alpha-ribazole phosphatase